MFVGIHKHWAGEESLLGTNLVLAFFVTSTH